MYEINTLKAINADKNYIWEILDEVVHRDDALFIPPGLSQEKIIDYWFQAPRKVFVAKEVKHGIIGSLTIEPKNIGLGSHIATICIVVHPLFRNKGVGTELGRFALQEAKNMGFQSIVLDEVPKTNLRALKVAGKLGFNVSGAIPRAFRHSRKGFVPTVILYRSL